MFSIFKDQTKSKPFETLSLQELHDQIVNPDREPFNSSINVIKRLRQTSDVTAQKKIKEGLPAFTPGAMLNTKQADATPEQKNIRYSGFMQIDIDAKDNPNMTDPEAIRDKLAQVPYIALSAISARGRGVWGLIALQEPEKFNAYSYQVYEYFKQARVNLDKSKGKNPTELRYFSPDAGAILKSNYLLLPLLPPQPKPPQPTGNKATGSALKELQKWVTETTGYIFEEGQKHMFIYWLSYALRKNGLTEKDVYTTIYKNILPKDQIRTNCISGGIGHANNKGLYVSPQPQTRPQANAALYSAKIPTPATPDYITDFANN